eukprot:gene352-1741_t
MCTSGEVRIWEDQTPPSAGCKEVAVPPENVKDIVLTPSDMPSDAALTEDDVAPTKDEAELLSEALWWQGSSCSFSECASDLALTKYEAEPPSAGGKEAAAPQENPCLQGGSCSSRECASDLALTKYEAGPPSPGGKEVAAPQENVEDMALSPSDRPSDVALTKDEAELLSEAVNADE